MIIKKVDEAIALPKGRIAINMGFLMEASFGVEDVAECAKLVIENNVEEEFYTQAGVVKYAGNELGWGLGGGYSTV